MPASCPNCRATLADETSSRCPSCGRSLVQASSQGSGTGKLNRASTEVVKTEVSNYVVHIIIGLICGIVGFVIMFFVSRRMFIRHADDPIVWVVIIGLGFCLPAVYGFRYSYQQDVIAKRRKQEGIKSMR